MGTNRLVCAGVVEDAFVELEFVAYPRCTVSPGLAMPCPII
jgi:hypothetical protein